MDDTGSSGRVTNSARERARQRDQAARTRLGLKPYTPRIRPAARHGDVGPGGDLVDELLRELRRPGDRAARLAACITAATPALAADQLANLLRTLDQVAS